MQQYNVTELRKDLYQAIDNVLESGRPIAVTRKGRRVMIVPGEQPKSKLANLTRRDGVVGDIDAPIWDEQSWQEKWDERLSEQ